MSTDQRTFAPESEQPAGKTSSAPFKRQQTREHAQRSAGSSHTHAKPDGKHGDSKVPEPIHRNRASNNFANNATASNTASTTNTVACFPPPRMTLNLKECKYDIFRRIGVEDMNYKVILPGEIIQTRQTIAMAQLKVEADEKTGGTSDSESEEDVRERASEAMKPETACAEHHEMFLGADEAPAESPTANRGNINPGFRKTAQATNERHGLLNRKFPNEEQKRGVKGVTSRSLFMGKPVEQKNAPPQTGEVQNHLQVAPEIQWDVLWQDFGIQPLFLEALKPHQRVNHFLGMQHIARKNTLGINLKRFQKAFPEEYSFFPQTWLYPSDFHEIQDYCARKNAKRRELINSGFMNEDESKEDPPVMLICKPEAGCQGRGIFVARKIEEVQKQIDEHLARKAKEFEEYLKAEASYDTALLYSQTVSRAEAKANATNKKTNVENNYGAVVIQENQQKEKAEWEPKYAGQLQRDENNNVEAPESVARASHFVVQKYLKYPALWKGHKFDFRIYVLVTSVIDPMTVFLYKDGLVRLASEKYTTGKAKDGADADKYIHLTNYSLNKKNDAYDGDAHKLKLSDVLKGRLTQAPQKRGQPTASRNANDIWREIEEIVIKTILTVQPQLQHIYRSCQTKEPDVCFELLGFDIMLDQKLRPWMLEVNHTPSFNSDTQCDAEVKNALVKNALEIIQLSSETRKRLGMEMKMEQREAQKMNNYTRLSVKEHTDRVRFDPTLVEKRIKDNKFKLIYPRDPGGANNLDLYEKILKKATEMWKIKTGTQTSKARENLATKKEKEDPPPKKPKKKKKKVAKPEKDAECTSDHADDEKQKAPVYDAALSQSWNPKVGQPGFDKQPNSEEKDAGLNQNGTQGSLTRNASSALRSKPKGPNDYSADPAQLQFNFLGDRKRPPLLQQNGSKRNLSAAPGAGAVEYNPSNTEGDPNSENEERRRPAYIPLQPTKSSQAKSKVPVPNGQQPAVQQQQQQQGNPPMAPPPATTPQLTSIAKLTLSLMGSMPPSAFSGLYEQLNGCKPSSMTQAQWQDLLKAASENLMARGSPLVTTGPGAGSHNFTNQQAAKLRDQQQRAQNADMQQTANAVVIGQKSPMPPHPPQPQNPISVPAMNGLIRERYREQIKQALSSEKAQESGYSTHKNFIQRSQSKGQIGTGNNNGQQFSPIQSGFAPSDLKSHLQVTTQHSGPGHPQQQPTPFQVHGIPNPHANKDLAQQQQPSLQFLSYLYQQFHKKSGDQYLLEKLHSGSQLPEHHNSKASEAQKEYERDLNQWFIARIKAILASELLNAASQEQRTYTQPQGPPLLGKRDVSNPGGYPQDRTLQGTGAFNQRIPPNVILTQPQPVQQTPFKMTTTNHEDLNELSAKGTAVWGRQALSVNSSNNGPLRRAPKVPSQHGSSGFTPIKTEIATVDMSAGFEQPSVPQTNHKRLYYVNISNTQGMGATPVTNLSQSIPNVQSVNQRQALQQQQLAQLGMQMQMQQQQYYPPQHIPINQTAGVPMQQLHQMQQTQQPLPGSRSSQTRQNATGNQYNQNGITSPKQTQQKHVTQQLHPGNLMRKPRELNQLQKGGNGQGKIPMQQERGRVVNLQSEPQQQQPMSQPSNGNDVAKQQQQQWMRKQSNTVAQSATNGKEVTISSNTIDAILGATENQFAASHQRASQNNPTMSQNYSDNTGVLIQNNNAMKQELAGVHLPSSKKPFSLAGALLNDYNRQTLMYQQPGQQPEFRGQQSNSAQPQSKAHLVQGANFNGQAATGFSYERNSLSGSGSQPPVYDHLIYKPTGINNNQVPHPRTLQTIGKIQNSIDQTCNSPDKRVGQSSDQQPTSKFFQDASGTQSALQQHTVPKQEAQRFQSQSSKNGHGTIPLKTQNMGDVQRPRPGIQTNTEMNSGSGGHNSQVRQNPVGQHVPTKQITSHQPMLQPKILESATIPPSAHMIVGGQIQQQPPMSLSAMGAAQNQPVNVINSCFRPPQKTHKATNITHTNITHPGAGHNATAGAKQPASAQLTSGIHSLEKLKEYESRLLLQNSQTQLNVPTHNTVSNVSKPDFFKKQITNEAVPTSQSRPLSNRQLKNVTKHPTNGQV